MSLVPDKALEKKVCPDGSSPRLTSSDTVIHGINHPLNRNQISKPGRSTSPKESKNSIGSTNIGENSSRSASFLSRVIAKRGNLEPLPEKENTEIPSGQFSRPANSRFYAMPEVTKIDNTSTLSNPRRRSFTVNTIVPVSFITVPERTAQNGWQLSANCNIVTKNDSDQERSKEATINDLKKRAELRKNDNLIKRVNSMPNGATAAVNSAREKFLAKIGEDPTK